MWHLLTLTNPHLRFSSIDDLFIKWSCAQRETTPVNSNDSGPFNRVDSIDGSIRFSIVRRTSSMSSTKNFAVVGLVFSILESRSDSTRMPDDVRSVEYRGKEQILEMEPTPGWSPRVLCWPLEPLFKQIYSAFSTAVESFPVELSLKSNVTDNEQETIFKRDQSAIFLVLSNIWRRNASSSPSMYSNKSPNRVKCFSKGQ